MLGGASSQTVKVVLNNFGRRYLVEHWQSEDGSQWYDRYSDGWVVQCGREVFKAQNPQFIQLFLAMNSTNYPIILTVNFARIGLWDWTPVGIPVSTTEFKVFNDQGAHSDIWFVWRVEGFAA